MHLSSVPRSWIVPGIAGCLQLLAAAGAAATAAQTEMTGSPVLGSFDIAAQPLVSALDSYSAASGMQVVYDGALASGRRSTAVRGAMAPDTALRRLLDGTGLVVLYAAPNVFTLQPGLGSRSDRQPTIGDYLYYLAAVQNSGAAAFCGHPLTVPGAYRIKLSFRIDPAGKVFQSQLLGSTEDGARDQAIAGLLQGLVIDRPPPPDMPQPVVMAISPRPPAETGDCRPIDPTPQRAALP